jgi:transcription-repair coupling factor (superfamily II helicase)
MTLKTLLDGLNDHSQIKAGASLMLELVASSIAKKQPVILVARNQEALSARLKNLRFFNPSAFIMALPMDERSVMHATSGDPMLAMEKSAAHFRIAAGEFPNILVVQPESLVERFPSATDQQKHAVWLIKDDKINRDLLISSLLTLGYSKVPTVIDRGTFAVRGSIIDIFVNGEKRPLRVDLFGDHIESIKYFDENTQRSIESISSIVVGGVREIFLDDDTKALSLEKLTHLADNINYPTKKLNEKLRDIDNGISFYGIEKLRPAFFSNMSSLLETLVLASRKDSRPLIIFDDKATVMATLTEFEKNTSENYDQALLRGDLVFSPADYFIKKEQLENIIKDFSSLDIERNLFSGTQQIVELSSRDTDFIRQEIMQGSVVLSKEEEPHLLKPLAKNIKSLHADKKTVVVSLSSREHEQEFKNLARPFGLNIESFGAQPVWDQSFSAKFKPHIHAYTFVNKAPLAFGGIFDFLNLALIAEDDIFGKRTKREGTSGKQKGFSTAISDLENGDFVVHVDHGVGQFKGLVRLNLRGVDNDYILITYAKDEKLYLPVHRINLIKPHGGSADGAVKVDKLGGTAWSSKKSKVKEAVMAMAQDLLKLYAKREIVERPPFFAPDAHFYEFEAAFEFETTPDQQKAIDDVISDLQRKQPMDRLVCGDVGYGKTEVAMRAAMMAVLSKRQVAILAPTTVLAQQHGITFKERFKNTGVNIAVLSRFQSAQEIKAALIDLRQNKVDIVIGTHRLLSPDVEFSNLGLIVVDEEQRFGIKAKEHLKKMRTLVDVLTMSATPIPRTMQMSYFGIRDLSVIETPPVDRRAIQTAIVQFDDAVIREAIVREISRGGQVYFVHNRVQSINATAEYLKNLVPEANIAVAHGQMGETELEKKMLSFMAHEINVLVCTTIIETGIDVSTANTMFIDDADDFGLSQLYQLRGRIGRSKERAFAFLLIKTAAEHLTPIAKTRLEILHKFSELGAGFRIAQHDLELRGAGDLLGKNQHGHMAAVGYDLYAELLKDAVKELQGQVADDAVDPEVILPVSALISDKYCPDLHERMSYYQRLASAETPEKIDGVIFDLEDLYGSVPDEVHALKISAHIKLALKKIHALRLEISRTAEEKVLSVSISLSSKTPIVQEKLLKIMNSNGPMRVTPQQKVLQTIGIASPNINEALLAASQQAIAQLTRDLL